MSRRQEFLDRLQGLQLPQAPAAPAAPQVPWQWQYAKPGPYVTQLDPQQEAQFQSWVKNYRDPNNPKWRVPFDPSPSSDYDMRGFWKAYTDPRDPRHAQAAINENPNDRRLHFSDPWKTPYHHSFSNESIYANPAFNPPQWNPQDQLVDRSGRVLYDERMAAPAPWTSATANIPTPQVRPLQPTSPGEFRNRLEGLRLPRPPTPLPSQQLKMLPTQRELTKNVSPGTIGPQSPLQRLQGLGMNYEPVRRAHEALNAAAPLLESATDLGNIAPGGEGALSAAATVVRTAEEEQGLLRSFGRMQRYMKPEIVEGLGNRIKANIADAFKSLPPTEEWEAAARAGVAKRGWYQKSGTVIRDTFKTDTPTFTGILAAQSPRQTVTENMKMAIRTYGEWVAAGRPQEPEAIMKVLQQVPGATMPSRVPNTIKAIQGQPLVDFTDPTSGGGYKVESFRRNLLGEMDWATNDTWMAKFSGKFGDWFGSKANYLAADAKTRQVAQQMGWSVAEVQETVWSFIKTLVEQTPRSSTLQEGLKGISHELIGQDTDFAQLLNDPDIHRELSRFGIQPPAGVAREGGAAGTTNVGGEKAGDPRVLERIARRLQRQGIEPLGAAVKGAPPP